MNVKKRIVSLVVLAHLIACTNTKESDLITLPCEDEITYAGCVKEIIDNNCIICHHSGNNALGPFPLETYTQVKDVAQNGNMLARIQLPDGADGIMPQTGKMPQANIDVIVAWANGGYKE